MLSSASHGLPNNAANPVAGYAAANVPHTAIHNTAHRLVHHLAHGITSCATSLSALCQRERGAGQTRDITTAVAAATATAAPTTSFMAPSCPSLPAEIWGEIAAFSERHDLLNLRRTCSQVMTEADRAITSMTITGASNLYALADSIGFRHIDHLQLHAVDDACLYYFARALHLQKRTGLTLVVQQSDIGTVEGASTLAGMPLAALKLICMQNLNRHTIQALKVCAFPIALIGHFSAVELAGLATIPMLTTLDSVSNHFTDDAADRLALHPALHTLSVRAFQNLSNQGIGKIASVPKLERLSLFDTDYISSRMSADAAAALAANPALRHLHIQTSVLPLAEASVAALSTSTSLRSLNISVGPGTCHIANLVALRRLTLRGRCLASPGLSVETAERLAHMPNLRCLNIEFMKVDDGALAALMRSTRISHLELREVAVGQDALDAILANHHLKALTLRAVSISQKQILALSYHHTLETLWVNYKDYPLHRQPGNALHYA